MTETPLISVVYVLIASVLGSFGAVFLKLGSAKLEKGLIYIVSWQSFAGVALYLASSVFYVAGVRNGELSVLYPMVALGYVWTLIWSRLLFGERITRQKLIAVFLILFGISLIGIGAQRAH
jgi:drug/metabolite transporter (DMT)-like permease